MKRIAAIVLLFGLIFPTLLTSQGETSNWYFGNGAGIAFNDDGTLTPLTEGKIDTFEGCATISDSFGNLLFYTDGITVYNEDHTILQNGQGLYGDPSSTQSALIVPKPQDPDIFFLFTVDTSTFEGDPDRGLNYSIIDMSLNNGKGAVTQKNVSLLSDCSEKITAVVKDCSDQSVWVMTLASSTGNNYVFDTYHAFEVNTTGVVKQSVRSTFPNLNIEDPRGYLKISPDGSKLASANMKDGLHIYNFDALSGIVSDQEIIPLSGQNYAPYGVEFSPNSQYLYIHASNDIFEETGNTSSLLQYDMLAPLIDKSVIVIDNRNIFRGALQLGANGKIYRTTAKSYLQGNPFLAVINNPNQKGLAVNYQHDVISLNGKNATQGLPPFIQSFFNKVGLLKNQDGTTSNTLEICENDSFTLEADAIPDGIYTWEKDGEQLANTSNILQVPAANEANSGKYRLTITTSNPADCPIIGEALVNVALLPVANALVLEQCDIDSDITDGFTLINLEQAIENEDFEYTFYENTQDVENNMPIANPERFSNRQAFSQTITYAITNDFGCVDYGELSIIVNTGGLVLNQNNPVMICDNIPDDGILEGTFDLEDIRRKEYPNLDVVFYHTIENASLEISPLDGNFTSTNTTLYARIENENQCQSIEILELEVSPVPHITLEPSYQVCTDGSPLTIEAPSGFDSYTWYDITNQPIQEVGDAQQVVISKGGSYSLEVGINFESGSQNITCYATFDFEVTPSNRAVFEEITITDFSENNTILVMVSGDGSYEYSIDGVTFQEESLFEDISPGFYTIFARDKNGCGISEEEAAVVGFPKFFTPNNDGANDTWQLIGASEDLTSGNVTIYDRYGKLVKQIGFTDKGWDGTVNGNPLPASDYWFKVAVEGRKEFKGHFALLR